VWKKFDKRRGTVGRPECDKAFLMAYVNDGIMRVLAEGGRWAEFRVQLIERLAR
jgi:hypothetical protein